MRLNRRVVDSSSMQRALRERERVAAEGLLLTIPFRTVEEYLEKLRLCSEALRDSQSLAVVYLAAAVSDFYVPMSKRSLHKIQSMDYEGIDNGNENSSSLDDRNCLTIKLHPVPKLLPELRERWAPDAFIVSFKLETDRNILRAKSTMAMKKYGVHMVIGNVLATRHQKVWCLQKRHTDGRESADGGGGGDEFEMREISRAGSDAAGIDELEDAMVGHVVERHFEHIATHVAAEGGGYGPHGRRRGGGQVQRPDRGEGEAAEERAGPETDQGCVDERGGARPWDGDYVRPNYHAPEEILVAAMTQVRFFAARPRPCRMAEKVPSREKFA